MSTEEQNVNATFSIETPTMTVSPAAAPEEKVRRGRPPKVAIKLETKEAETPRLIRVRPVHGYGIYCHTQGKLIHAGFETSVLRDSWISNQIRKGILQVVG